MKTENLEDLYELSPMQQGILFHHILAPGSGVYIEQLIFNFRGDLRPGELRRAFEKITRRHPILRTSFHWQNLEKPLQAVHRWVELPWEDHDWRHVPAGQQEEKLQAFLDEDRFRGFDLTRAPLMKIDLFRFADDLYRFTWGFSHLLLDGWSFGVLSQEWIEYYKEHYHGRDPGVPPPPRPYREYVRWVRSQDMGQAEAFWRRELAGYRRPIQLRAGREPGLAPGQTATHLNIEYPLTPMVEELQSFARRNQLTINTLLQGAWTLVLHRYTGERDVVFGSTVSGRSPDLKGSDRMVGVMIDTLPTRVAVDPDAVLLPWLRDLQARQVKCREFESTSLTQIHGWSELGRDVPLFETIALLENVPLPQIDFTHENLELLAAIYDGRPHYAVIVEVFPPPDMPLRIIYDRRRYTRETIHQIWRHLRAMLQGITADPARRLGEIPMLSEEERRQVLDGWNGTAAGAVEPEPLHRRFGAQARHTPDRAALTCGDATLTYGELDRRASRLAHRLRALGVGPERRVGLLVERSPELVVAVLGVLAAGGAYVPLDPAWPRERLAFMLADAGLSALLTGGRPLADLPVPAGLPVFALAALDERLARGSGDDAGAPDVAVEPESLAYLIYTSGSTGRPKGVALTHRSAVALLYWARETFSPEDLAGVLASTSICFDLSVFELFVPLSWGGRVILADNAMALPGLAAAAAVTLVNTVPSAMAELLRAEGLPASVRVVNLAGEPLPAALADRIYAQTGARDVFDLYGPSEDTTYSTFARRSPGGPETIGRPLAGTQVYLLDDRFEPVPPGVAGHLYIGGRGLARGYHDRPELTAERFLPNPFSAAPGERLYRTGDLARHLEGGDLHFLGRSDHQVKIRGFRIELGEIETVLEQHPAVRQAVVVAREEPAGNTHDAGDARGHRLVAYVVPAADRAPTVAELRAALRQKLPDSMLPSAFAMLSALPLTPGGKVDRRALPALDPGRPDTRGELVAPRTATEELLAGIWKEVLGVEQVGVDDSFFDLGGHSLLATQVSSRVRKALQVELPLRALFDAPTVAELAQRIERLRRAGEGRELPPIAAVPRRGRLPLSFAQERLWFLDQLHPETSTYHIPIRYRIEGPLQVAVLERVVTEIARRQEGLRTTFQVHDGEPWQRIAPPAPFALAVIDLSGLAAAERGAESERLAAAEVARLFDLSRGPLLRLHLLRFAPAEHLLLGTMHHIVSDGWSLRVMVQELAVLYAAFASGRPSPLPDLAIQYADFAVWQRAWLEGEVLESELACWRRRLGGSPPVLELPTDRPRPAAQSFRGGQRSLAFAERVSQGLGALCQAEGVTLFMALLAAFQAFLVRQTGQGAVHVGCPMSGRNRLEIEGLIGFFVNTVVMRGEAGDDPPLRTLLQRTREAVLEADAHQDVPFEKLVQELEPERSLSYTPLFQVMLTFRAVPQAVREVAGLRMSGLQADVHTSKFDLTLALSEERGRLSALLRYNGDLFEPVTIERMLGHFANLLEGMAADPQRRLSDLPMLTEAERHQVVTGWNDTAAAAPGECVHERFAAWAARTPGAPAVACEGEELAYGELSRWANRLARHLRGLGVGPEVRVALCAERSLDMIAGLLGILAAGGAYVPLDPSFPDDRLAWLLADSGAAVALVQERFRHRFATAAGARLVSFEADAPEIDRQSGEPPAGPAGTAGLDHLAYVIYTSGSTGRPKGVAIEHRQLASYVDAVVERLGLGECASFATVSTIAADLGNTVVFPALVTGGCLHVISRERAADAEAFADYFERHAIDCLKIVPSHLAALQTTARPERALPRRRLVLGGEASSLDEVRRLQARAPGCRIFNHYGPTETTVGVIVHPAPDLATMAPAGHLPAILPLGRPLPNAEVYLLDAHLQPVPAGVSGELHIGGAGLARGYLDRPALTAERFIPNPFRGTGARLYKSGDRARTGPDGVLEFLGRLDEQVKIRGFRIELGEIAAALREHPDVAEAVVIVPGATAAGGERRLVAYLVPSSGAAPEAAQLDAFLRQRLPDFMVPAVFVPLAAIPLTANGKVDRRALPPPEPPAAEASAPPRTAVEERLAGLWAAVLERPRVGIHEDFFALGGHSLLATQLVSRVRRAFGVELPLRCLFEAPTVAALAERIEAERRERQGLQPPPIVRTGSAEGAPLSFAQERLWFLDQLDPGKATYNLPYFARVKGPLDVAVLAATLVEIMRRHEALRTRFPAVDGWPVQTVDAPPEPRLPVIDLAALPGERRREESSQLAAREARTPFDLACDRLVRARLVRLGREEHLLLLAMHHIVSDAWSRGVLARELSVLYPALAQGAPAPLPELPVQYADFARWQRAWLRGEPLERLLAWWRERLGGSLPPLQLPTDRPRPAVRSARGGARRFALSSALAVGLRDLARREGSTLYMVLLAGFDALLHRYTGHSQVVVGSPIANRNREEIEGLIGFFVNTLALRVELGGDPGFRDLLGRVGETALGAYDHQDLPFELLVEDLAGDRALNRSPLFQVMFLLQNAPMPGLGFSGLAFESVETHTGTAKFDLTLGLVEADPAVSPEMPGMLEFDLDLFDEATIARLLEHFSNLLEGIVADPGRRLSELALLGPAETAQVVTGWNATAVGYPADLCLHELVRAQAARTPDAEAVVGAGERLSYRELERRADRLAHHLRELGVGPEARVGVFLDRSPDLVWTLLGVLAAGGAYVPLDPAYPEERLAFLLADAGARVLVTRSDLLARLPAHDARTVCLDSVVWPQREGAPQVEVAPESLAYLIYTSGSTGRPKGVALTHRSAVALLHWARDVFPPADLAGVLASTSVCFDLSVFELFVPLAWGGRVILADNVLALPGLAAAREVTLVNTVPSALAELLRSSGLPASVRVVNLAGEPLAASLVDRIYAGTSVRDVFDLYGPSEDTTYSTFARRSPGGPQTIGRPIANTRAYVLDAALRPVPAGVPGELYLAGEGLARGYLDRPELTAERFMPDPFSGCSGAGGSRLYRTGDRVRHLPEGDLEFLGRLDHQVKVRGFRIELGEIEAALAHAPGVRDAVVLAREDASGDRSLAACVVPRDGTAPTAAELRRALRETLPDYLVPSAFVILPALPRTPNGKIDRRALASMPEMSALSPARREGPFVAPRTPAEELVAGLWADVLGAGRVGIHDNFFELGGHSLLATRVASRVRKAFQVELPLRAIFEAPTVAELARSLETLRRSAGAPPEPPIVRVPRGGHLPLSFSQERLWFLEQLHPGTATYNIPFAFHLAGPLRPDVLARAFREIVRRHESLRTTFALFDGEPVQRVSEETGLDFAVVDLEGLAQEREAEADRLAALEARRPFDLTQGPLLRVRLLRLAAGEHVLTGAMHHIVSDGWSLKIFLRELSALYETFEADRPAPLPELEIQYADFVAWQRSALRREALDAELACWRDRLAGAPPLELPTDRPRPAVQGLRGGRRPLALPPTLAGALAALGRSEGATPFMTLLATLQALLARYSGQDDVSVGTPVAGRNRLEIEDLIGLFVNTLVLRGDLAGDPSFRALLHQARERVLEADAHQGLPFERLVQELDPERSLSRSPLFQVMLAFQSAPRDGLRLAGRPMTPLPADSGTEKFDLTLTVVDDGERMTGGLGYDLDLFDEATIARLLEHFSNLLEGIVADPGRRLSELALLGPAETAQVVTGWNATAVGYPADLCLHELVRAQAARTPDAEAVVGAGERLSYRELERRADRLAHHLRELGVGPEARVGVFLDRSPDLVWTLLGVLAAGGAYVPLDPAYPEERLAFLLADAGARVLVTRSDLLARLPAHDARTVCLDSVVWPQREGAPQVEVAPESLAYLIYTSGSTGRPKGVALTHRSAVALLHWARDVFPPADLAGVLASTSVCFDLSVFELFVPLAWGGRVILADNVLALPGLAAAREVTLVNTVPSALAELLRSSGLPASVRVVNLAGEPLAASLVDRIYAGTSVRDVFDLYGPSEDTTYSTFARRSPGGPQTIGRPIANTRAYVLDAALRPVPAGVPGELYLAGEGLARGYLDRPELTAERFVPDPFSGCSGAGGSRLYRTGDRVRHLPEGDLEFLGRLDHQVKVRGFRIELGEIEAALAHAPGVRDAVVLAREDAGLDRRLVAYLVPAALDLDAVRRDLRARLPEYMLPAAFVTLAALPLTPGGKVDRRALPAPEWSPAGALVGPRDDVELALSRIWEALLGGGPVGVHDDFFDRGGHSLLAVRLMARMRRDLGVDLPVSSLFQAPTVERLAALVRHGSAPQRRAALVQLQPGAPGRPPLFCVHPVGGEVLCYLDLARQLGPDQPVYGLQVPDLDGDADLASLEGMARHYVDAIRQVQPEGGYHLLGWSMGGLIAFEMAGRLGEAGQSVDLLALLDSHVPGTGGMRREVGEEELIGWFAFDLAGLGGKDPNLLLAAARQEDGTLSLDRVLGRARSEGLLATGLEPEDLRRRFAVFKANREAMGRYAPQRYPGRAVLFKAGEVLWNETEDPTLGWGERVEGGLEVAVLPGNHYTIVRQPRALAERLRSLLDEAPGAAVLPIVDVRSMDDGTARRNRP